MRHLHSFSVAIFLVATMALLSSACTSGDDVDAPTTSQTLAANTSASLNHGGLAVTIAADAVGADANDLPDGASIALSAVADRSQEASVQAVLANAKALSPTYRVEVKDMDGTDVSNTSVGTAHRVTLVPYRDQLSALGLSLSDLVLVKISAGGTIGLTHSTSESVDSTFVTNADGNASALVSSFSDFLLVGLDPDPTPDPDPDPDPDPLVFAGTLTTAGELVTTIMLNHESNGQAITVVAPDALLTVPNIPISMDPSNFDIQDPTSVNNRSLALTDGDLSFTSFNVGASVVVTLTSRNGADTAGTITGTAIDGFGVERELDITFTTTAPAASTEVTQVVDAFELDAAGTHAAANAAVYNGTDFIALSLGSDNGGATRTIRSQSVAGSDGMAGTPDVITPTQDFIDADSFEASFGDGHIFVVGENASDGSGSVVCHVLNANGADLGSPLGFAIATGTNPKIAYNATTMRFAIAMETATGVALYLYSADGTEEAGPIAISAESGDELRGLCASGVSGEFLITYSTISDDSLNFRRVSASDGALSGAVMLDAMSDAGACAYDAGDDVYLVMRGDTQLQFTALTPGSDTIGMSADAPLTSAASAVAGGAMGVLFAANSTVPVVGEVLTFAGALSESGTVNADETPFAPQVSSGLAADFNDNAIRLAIAGDGNGRFLVLGRSSTSGVEGVILAIGDDGGN